MIFVISNSILIFLLIMCYFAIEKQLSKKMFFDVSILKTYRLYISPIILSILNAILILIFSVNYWYTVLIPLLIPLYAHVVYMLRNKKQTNNYLRIKEELSPIIIAALNEKEIAVDKNDISMVYYKQKKEEHIDIYISIPVTDSSINTINKLERYLTDINKKYITRVFLEKKKLSYSSFMNKKSDRLLAE